MVIWKKNIIGKISNICVADGPAGLRLQKATSFPVELALAQTWNTTLLEEVGYAVSEEMHTYGVSYWLAPALNIHRNPLCGRNFEYFSEDPFLSGKMTAALTKGVQKIVDIRRCAANVLKGIVETDIYKKYKAGEL